MSTPSAWWTTTRYTLQGSGGSAVPCGLSPALGVPSALLVPTCPHSHWRELEVSSRSGRAAALALVPVSQVLSSGAPWHTWKRPPRTPHPSSLAHCPFSSKALENGLRAASGGQGAGGGGVKCNPLRSDCNRGSGVGPSSGFLWWWREGIAWPEPPSCTVFCSRSTPCCACCAAAPRTRSASCLTTRAR